MGKSRGSGYYKDVRKKRPKEFTTSSRFISTVKDTVVRPELYDMVGEEVRFSGDMLMKAGPRTGVIPMVVSNLYVKGEFVDHVWIELGEEDWAKLQLGTAGMRVYFTGVVYKYLGNTNTKMGFTNVRLVTV